MKVRLKYPLETVKEPVLYHMIMEHHVIPNILRAHVDHETGGEIDLYIEGEPEAIARSVKWLSGQGIGVTELAA